MRPIEIGANRSRAETTQGLNDSPLWLNRPTPKVKLKRPGLTTTHILRTSRIFLQFWLVVLVFYGPSTHYRSFRVRSVNLATLFLGKPPRQFTFCPLILWHLHKQRLSPSNIICNNQALKGVSRLQWSREAGGPESTDPCASKADLSPNHRADFGSLNLCSRLH